MSHRLWEIEPPTFGKSVTDFEEIRNHLAVEIRKPASVVKKNYMDKTWLRL